MRLWKLGSCVACFVVGCTGSVVDEDDPKDGTGGALGAESGGSGAEPGSTGGSGAAPSGTGGALGTGGQSAGGTGGTTTGPGGMGGQPTHLGGQGGAGDDSSVPWEVTAILVDDPHPNAGPDDKRIIVWSHSSYDCSEPNGGSFCDPERDHGRLSVPIAATQMQVGSFEMANHSGYSAMGPNEGADDCWGGGGTLEGDVEVKSVSATSLVVRLSNLQLFEVELANLFESQDIEVVICQ